MVDLGLLSVRRVTRPKVSSTLISLYMLSGLSFWCQVFVCVGALAILDRLDEVDQERLAWWLAERQLPNGGLNGRPEKLADVSNCIAFQSSALTLGVGLLQLLGALGNVHIEEVNLDRFRQTRRFHPFCRGTSNTSQRSGSTTETPLVLFQDPDSGGIADRAGNQPDVFHTLFGVAGKCIIAHTFRVTIK